MVLISGISFSPSSAQGFAPWRRSTSSTRSSPDKKPQQGAEKRRNGGFMPPSGIENNRAIAGSTRRHAAPIFISLPSIKPNSDTLAKPLAKYK